MSDYLPMGWVCPQCGHVWAPRVAECVVCRRTLELIRRDEASQPAGAWVETRTETGGHGNTETGGPGDRGGA